MSSVIAYIIEPEGKPGFLFSGTLVAVMGRQTLGHAMCTSGIAPVFALLFVVFKPPPFYPPPPSFVATSQLSAQWR